MRAVCGVSFTVDAGETLGIVGESGAGKTALALALMGLLPDASHVTGSVRLRGEDLLGRSDADLSRIRGKDIAMVFQDALSALTPVHTVGGQIAEAVRIHRRVSRAAARARAVELLRLVGISGRWARAYPHQLSGGMRQRVMIAMAVANDPVAIVADEPTTALDPAVQAEVLDVLRVAQKATGAAILLITHDLQVAAGFADRVMVMRAGRVAETGPADLLRPPRIEPAETPPDRPDRPVVLRVDGLVRHHSLHKGPLVRRRAGTVRAVDGITFDVREGETLALMGESGSGKTTTLMEILQMSRPQKGRITVLGHDTAFLRAARRRALRKDVQVVFQDTCASLNPRMRVSDILTEPLATHGQPIGDRVEELLNLVGLEPGHARRYPGALSGGQRQRVAMARALALEPRLLLLDEPVSALDVAVQARVLDLLRSLRARLGQALLLVAHDLALVHTIADRIAVMHMGRIVEIGSTAEVCRAPAHPYTRALLNALPTPDLRPNRRLRDDPSDGSPSGCRFRVRCPHYVTLSAAAKRQCEEDDPEQRPVKSEKNADQAAACHHPLLNAEVEH
ncbi:dipeptide ABC transporter ATP-binding protein [Spirillospora sp. CA-142024]|uniref:dipeptide ABC transporter ATP-binding protein n=1 Tax=Spirillospora sp. CA-142024 TaxID=3240036 RepID=UPI003D929D70